MVNAKPQILIFDVDGVLVDVRGSFHKSTLDTVHYYTGKKFRPADILRWKNQSGYILSSLSLRRPAERTRSSERS